MTFPQKDGFTSCAIKHCFGGIWWWLLKHIVGVIFAICPRI